MNHICPHAAMIPGAGGKRRPARYRDNSEVILTLYKRFSSPHLLRTSGRGFPKMHDRSYVAEAMAYSRTRQSWNERLEHWEKPASLSEEEIVERAASMVRETMARNRWFTAEGVQIVPQGSYYNNTNVRRESDMDLRAIHPSIYIKYAPGVVREYAYRALAYYSIGRTYGEGASQMRTEISRQLTAKFGVAHVDATGSKAIRLIGVAGSRANLDIVPCFVHHHVVWNPVNKIYQTINGIAILDRTGGLTIDFPEQHHNNGIAKRARTRFRFKKNVRMLKNLRDELVEQGIFGNKELPSYLIESLVYQVEDDHFLVDWDDRYDRLLRIVERMWAQLNVPDWSNSAREINDIKLLFGPHQPWSLETAKKFAEVARIRLAV
jgi:hypothetical protein